MLAFIDDKSDDVAAFVIHGLGHQSYSTTPDQAIRNGLGKTWCRGKGRRWCAANEASVRGVARTTISPADNHCLGWTPKAAIVRAHIKYQIHATAQQQLRATPDGVSSGSEQDRGRTAERTVGLCVRATASNHST
jgi:hypothetical protein